MFNKIVSVFLLVIFLGQNTGMTLVHHFCAMSNTREIASVDGINGDDLTSCGCDEAESSPIQLPSDDPQTIDAPSCCYNVLSFLKFDFSSILSLSTVLLPIDGLLTGIIFISSHFEETNQSVPDYPFFQFYSPPLSGIRLLHFIHQIKIPVSLV